MKRTLTVAALTITLLCVSGSAFAAWLADAGSGQGSTSALSMPTGSTPTAPANSTGSVTLTWTAAQLAGNDLTTYTVRRYPAAGGAGTVITCASQTITDHVVSCTYNETAAGSYQFTDTPHHANWVGTESAKSGTTVVASGDTTAPNVTVNAVPTPSNNNKPAFSGGYGTAVGDNPSVTVQVRSGTIDGTVVASPTATVNPLNSTWSTAALASALPDGTYVVAVTQTDLATNSKTVSATFLVDTVKPAPTITSPADGTVVPNGQVAISGTGGLAAGDGATVTVVVNDGTSTSTLTANVNQQTGAWSVTTGVGNKKTVNVTVTQTDWANNSGTATSSFST